MNRIRLRGRGRGKGARVWYIAALTLSKPGFFWAPKTKGGGGGTLCPLAKTLLPFSESIQVNFF